MPKQLYDCRPMCISPLATHFMAGGLHGRFAIERAMQIHAAWLGGGSLPWMRDWPRRLASKAGRHLLRPSPGPRFQWRRAQQASRIYGRWPLRAIPYQHPSLFRCVGHWSKVAYGVVPVRVAICVVRGWRNWREMATAQNGGTAHGRRPGRFQGDTEGGSDGELKRGARSTHELHCFKTTTFDTGRQLPILVEPRTSAARARSRHSRNSLHS